MPGILTWKRFKFKFDLPVGYYIDMYVPSKIRNCAGILCQCGLTCPLDTTCMYLRKKNCAGIPWLCGLGNDLPLDTTFVRKKNKQTTKHSLLLLILAVWDLECAWSWQLSVCVCKWLSEIRRAGDRNEPWLTFKKCLIMMGDGFHREREDEKYFIIL